MPIPKRSKIGFLILLVWGFGPTRAGDETPNAAKKMNEAAKKEAALDSQQMNNTRLETILKSAATIQEGSPGYWQLIYKGRILLVITDESADRMRMITPVIEAKELGEEDLKKVMEANFHSALDARYALYNDFLWSVYIHPLGNLSEAQFRDAMDQVSQLADTYGGSFSSTAVIFGGQE